MLQECVSFRGRIGRDPVARICPDRIWRLASGPEPRNSFAIFGIINTKSMLRELENTVLIDQITVRDHLKTEMTAQCAAAIDNGRYIRPGRLRIRPGGFWSFMVQRDRKYLESVVARRFYELSPPGQLVTALSPRRPHEEETSFSGQPTQIDQVSIEIGQHNLRKVLAHAASKCSA